VRPEDFASHTVGLERIAAREGGGVLGRISSFVQLDFRTKYVYLRNRRNALRRSGVNSGPFTVFWYVLAGRRWLFSEGKEYMLEAGDFVVFLPHIDITLGEEDDGEKEPFEYLSLGCEAKISAFNFVEIYAFPKTVKFPQSAAVSQFVELWRRIADYSEDHKEMLNTSSSKDTSLLPTAAQYSVHNKLYVMLTQWFSQMLELMLPYLPPTQYKMDHRVQQACTFIREKMNSKLTLKDIADYVFISEPHLRTLFLNALGMSPMNYLRKERLLRAKELLFSTNYRLKEIAEMIGYHEQGQLSRAFRLAEGISPLEYRQRSQTWD
jgi:AraC family transcriptional regulator of arabinose operon